MNIKDLDYTIYAHFFPHKISYAGDFKGSMVLKRMKKTDKMLDIGVGCGWLSRMAVEKGFNVEGVDIADKVIKENLWMNKVSGIKIKIKKASVYKLPFRKESFDYAVISEVLEHLEHPEKAMQEVSRVLKPKGTLFIFIPGYTYNLVYDRIFLFLRKLPYFNYDVRMNKNFRKYKLSHDEQFEDEHRLGYTTESLKKSAERSGYRVTKIENAEFLSPFFNTILCNVLKIPRSNISFLEKFDTILMKRLPLFLGSDWLLTCKKQKPTNNYE